MEFSKNWRRLIEKNRHLILDIRKILVKLSKYRFYSRIRRRIKENFLGNFSKVPSKFQQNIEYNGIFTFYFLVEREMN